MLPLYSGNNCKVTGKDPGFRGSEESEPLTQPCININVL